MVVDTGQMVLDPGLFGMLDRIYLLLDGLFDLPEHVIFSFLDTVIFIVSFMNQDMDLGLWVVLYQELEYGEEVGDGLDIWLLLDIDQINDALGLGNLLKIFWLGFLDIEVPWEIKEVQGDVGPDLLRVVLHLGGWVQHVLSLLWIHLLQDDSQDTGLP